MFHLDIELHWGRIRDSVFNYCLRMAGNDSLAADAFRATAARVQRGYTSLRHPSELLAWSQTLARAEVCRLVHAKLTAQRETTPDFPGESWLRAALEHARREQWLTESDTALLAETLTLPQVDWAQVGRKYNLGPAQIAARQARVRARFWFYLLTRKPELVATQELLQLAFDHAQADAADPLTAEQAGAFRGFVLATPPQDARRPGWREDLEAACNKVIRFLPV
jgi:hypothetical protein